MDTVVYFEGLSMEYKLIARNCVPISDGTDIVNGFGGNN